MLIYLVGLIYWMCLFFDLLRRCVCVVLGVAYLVGLVARWLCCCWLVFVNLRWVG